jgi:hypothetical protein
MADDDESKLFDELNKLFNALLSSFSDNVKQFFYPRPPILTQSSIPPFAVQDLQPPGLLIQQNEFLRVFVSTYDIASTLFLYGMVVTDEGEIKNFQQHIPTSPFSFNFTDLNVQPGWLQYLNVTAAPEETAATFLQYVSVYLVKQITQLNTTIYRITSGAVTAATEAVFPQPFDAQQQRQPLVWYRLQPPFVSGTTIFTFTCPPGVSTLVRQVSINVSTSATAGSRTVFLIHSTATLGIAKYRTNVVQSASQNLFWLFCEGMTSTYGISDTVYTPLTPAVVMRPGEKLQGFLSGFQTGDQVFNVYLDIAPLPSSQL